MGNVFCCFYYPYYYDAKPDDYIELADQPSRDGGLDDIEWGAKNLTF